MAFTCGFFNSENGDRKYNAEQMSAIFDGIIADGVFTTIGDHMAVSAGTGMQVLVGTGKAWFDHTWNVNDAAYPLTIAASDVTLSRIDAIVLETNHSDSVRLNKLRVVQGTVASSPAKPTLTNSEKVHQHPLAWVTVKPGVTQIAASAIENAVGTLACPFVTGIIATTAIDDLFNQWNGEFDEWFDNLKAQLSDNVVANLQKQIDANKTAIEKSEPKIGDIQYTTRKDLGDKWLLCNGDQVNENDYPELTATLNQVYVGKIVDSPSVGGDVLKIINQGGVLIQVGYPPYPNDMKTNVIVSNNPNGPWTHKQLIASSGSDATTGVAYDNGRFVVVGSSAHTEPFIGTATDPFGTWTVKKLPLSDGMTVGNQNAVTYYNGSWIVLANEAVNFQQISSYSRPYIHVASDPLGTWTSHPVTCQEIYPTTNTYYKTYDIACHGGHCVIVGGTTITDSNAAILIATTPTGPWTYKVISTKKSGHLSRIYYYNGLWITHILNSPYIFTTTNPAAEWSMRDLGDIKNIKSIVYSNGIWYILTTNKVFTTTNIISGDFIEHIIETSVDSNIPSFYDMALYNNNIVVAGSNATGRDTNNWVSMAGYLLPSISVNRSYAYIKAKG